MVIPIALFIVNSWPVCTNLRWGSFFFFVWVVSTRVLTIRLLLQIFQKEKNWTASGRFYFNFEFVVLLIFFCVFILRARSYDLECSLRELKRVSCLCPCRLLLRDAKIAVRLILVLTIDYLVWWNYCGDGWTLWDLKKTSQTILWMSKMWKHQSKLRIRCWLTKGVLCSLHILYLLWKIKSLRTLWTSKELVPQFMPHEPQ